MTRTTGSPQGFTFSLVVFPGSEDGHFSCRDSFLACMRASMCVPGVAGPSVRLQTLLGPHGDVTQVGAKPREE